MANDEKKVWGIHTMDDNLFLNKNVIAIGWKEFGDCSKLEPTREAYKNHYIKVYPIVRREQSLPAPVCCIGSLVRCRSVTMLCSLPRLTVRSTLVLWKAILSMFQMQTHMYSSAR